MRVQSEPAARVSPKIYRGILYWTIAVLVLLAGIALRAITYYFRTDFWGDEAAVAYNICTRSFSQLAHPMSLDQVAGCGFLALVKSFVIAFGNNEHVFRLFSLLSGCAVLILFFVAAWRFANRSQAMMGLALLAASPALVRYSSELKPYTTDAAVTAALMLLFFVVLKTRDARPLIGLGFAGIIAPWLSLPAVFVLAGFGLCCIVAALAQNDRKWVAIWSGLALLWGVSFLIEYFLTLRPSTGSSYLLRYWSGAFIALPPRSLAQARKLIGGPAYMFVDLFGVRFRYLAAALAIFGAVVVARKNLLRSCMLVSPFVLVLIASSFHKYPFSGRLLLFLVPLLALLIAAGIDAFWSRQWLFKSIALILLVGLLFKPVADDFHSVAASVQPASQPGMAAAVAFLQDHVQPTDSVVVSDDTNWTYTYYAWRAGLTHRVVFLPETDRITSASLPPQSAEAHSMWVMVSTFRSDRPDSEFSVVLSHAREVGRQESSYPFEGIVIVQFAVP